MYIPVNAHWHMHVQGKLIIGKLWKVPCTLKTGGNGVHQKNIKHHFSEGKTVKMHSWTFINNTQSRLVSKNKGSWNHTVFQENQSWFLMHFHYSQMHCHVFMCNSHIEFAVTTHSLVSNVAVHRPHACGRATHPSIAQELCNYILTYMCRSNSVLLSLSYLCTYVPT